MAHAITPQPPQCHGERQRGKGEQEPQDRETWCGRRGGRAKRECRRRRGMEWRSQCVVLCASDGATLRPQNYSLPVRNNQRKFGQRGCPKQRRPMRTFWRQVGRPFAAAAKAPAERP